MKDAMRRIAQDEDYVGALRMSVRTSLGGRLRLEAIEVQLRTPQKYSTGIQE